MINKSSSIPPERALHAVPSREARTALTTRQVLFCKEYAIDFNGKHAAIRAGYSSKTAEQQASRLLRNVKVQKMLVKSTGERPARLEVHADRILSELIKIAYVKIETGGIYKPADQLRALELLGKYKGLFE